MNYWLYENKEVTENDIPDEAVGFVYKIIHEPTGKYYIGKKSLSSSRTVKIGKRELQTIKQERKENKISGRLPTKKVVRKTSDWVDYYSSNITIKNMVKEGKANEFKRIILQFCNSKKALTYYELKTQIQYNVLEDDNSLNENILGKYFRKDLI